MINKCILPLNESTPVSYNLLFAIPLKIALSDLEIRNDVDNWIYSNYIQLLCFSKEKHRGFSRLNFFESYNPFVKRSLNIILNKKRKPDFYLKTIISKIEKGVYCNILLDQYYLPGYSEYHRTHVNHTECIYGYDFEKKEIYLFGFSRLSQGHAENMTVSFDDFKKAMTSALNSHTGLSYIVGHSKKKKKTTYNLNYKLIYWGYRDYVNSKISLRYILFTQIRKPIYSYNLPIHDYFGFAVYKHMVSILKEEFDSTLNYAANIPRIALLAEHDELMKKRFEYIYKQQLQETDESKVNNIAKLYALRCQNSNKFKIIYGLYLKYNITHDKKVLKKVILLLEDFICDETKFLEAFLPVLRADYKNKRSNLL
jgi:hypothetical protein